jgi:ribosomal-protein-alanine N-acetyltransferase
MNAVLSPPRQGSPDALPRRRAMTLADVGAVLALEVRAYSYPWSRGNFIDSLAAGYLADVLVDEEDAVLGYFLALPGVGELHLLNVTVAPEHQCRGLGRCLMQALHGHAQRLGLGAVFLEVRASNLRARALYARLGYAEVGLRRGYYPATPRREDAIVMRRCTTLPRADQPDADQPDVD